MTTAEIIANCQRITAMERDMADARRAITLAEVDLIFAAKGDLVRMNDAQLRFGQTAQILNKWSQQK